MPNYKIVYLRLLTHFTHLLKSLDIGVFGLLKQNYKTLRMEKTLFIMYNINKANFISSI